MDDATSKSESLPPRRRSPRRRRQERVALLRSRIRPLKVLLLGRKHRRTSGGIGRSALMIVEALKSVGDEVRLRSVNDLLADIPSDTDIIWHYGDNVHLDQHIEAAVEHEIPIVINSAFDNTADRRRWMINLVESWSNWPKVFFGVFAESARIDARFFRIRERLVALPKTVRMGDGFKPFQERAGVCIGELEKLRRSRLVRGMDVQAAVDELRTAMPDVAFTCYNQYGTAGTVPLSGVEVVSPGKDMLSYLGGLRLFISFTSHETFSMVPCEAQGVGTPVLYRPMPQSLSEHFGFTAYPFDSIGELAIGAMKLYEDERLWNSFSAAGGLNAEARSVNSVGAALDLALRKVAFR